MEGMQASADIKSEMADVLADVGLVYTSEDQPGLRRITRRGKTVYVDASGRTLRAVSELARIKSLAVPPAWTEVWIAGDPRGHLQAVGRDARGRKQYRYHPEFRAHRETAKFEGVDSQAKAKSNVRRAIERVSSKLGNTPAICRKCYVHPDILGCYMAGSLVEAMSASADRALTEDLASLAPEEAAVLALLRARLHSDAASGGMARLP